MQKFLKREKIKIRKVSLKDTMFLYNIYNQNVKDNNFFTNKKLDYSEHKLWLKNNIKKNIIFICYNKHKLGYVRFDRIKFKNFKISIAIKNSHKNKGIGKFLLFKSLKKIKLDKFNIYAKIKRSNYASKKFFLSFNFKFVKQNKYMLKYIND